MRYRDHLIARTNAKRAHRENKRIGAAAHADCMRDTAIIGESALEVLDFLAEDIAAAVEHPRRLQP